MKVYTGLKRGTTSFVDAYTSGPGTGNFFR